MELVKTITYGLGRVRSYNPKTSMLTELDETARKRVYEETQRGFRDFARICNVTTSTLYAMEVLHVKPKDWGLNKGYKWTLKHLDIEQTPLSGYIINQTHGLCQAHFTGEHRKSLLYKGESVLPVHRANGTHPIYIHQKAVRIIKDGDHFLVALNLFAKKRSDQNGVPSWVAFPLVVKPRDKSARGELERIVQGEWHSKSARLIRKPHKKLKYIIQVSVAYEPIPYKPLRESVIMGVDLGVNAPAVVHIRDSGEGQAWAATVGHGRDLLLARNRIRREINGLLRVLKSKDSPLIGKDRDAPQNRLRDLRAKERRVLKTASQGIASSVARIARRNGAGTWQIEDLGKGIALKEDQPWLARNWAPGMVIDALRWQAKQLGVNLVTVDPRNTSKRCSSCGHIDSANRPKRTHGAGYFRCVRCGHEENADKNAARNLSILGIDRIIKDSHQVEAAQA